MKLMNGALGRLRDYVSFDERLRILIISGIILNFGTGLWSPLLGLYVVNSLGVSMLMFGLMSTVQSLVSSLTMFPAGIFSDVFGRKRMMVLSVVLSVLSLVALFFVRDLPWLFLVSIFQGLSLAFIGPSRSAYIIDSVPNERRGKAFATLAFFQSLSGVIATSISGVIAGIFGFHSIFIIAFCLGILSFIVKMLYLNESLSEDVIELKQKNPSFFRRFVDGLSILKSPFLLAVLFSIVFHRLGLGIQGPYLTLYARNILLFSLPAVSLMLGLERMGIFIGHLPGGRTVDRYGGEISFAFHIFTTSPAMILFTFTGNPIFTGVILFCWGLTFGLDNVSRQKLIPKYSSGSGVAAAFGVISLIAGVVSLISPTIGGLIWTNYSPQMVFYVSAAVNVLGSLPLFILWLYNRRKLAI
jgi:DHA1 family multidrug resistance protein-like MFS transporter